MEIAKNAMRIRKSTNFSKPKATKLKQFQLKKNKDFSTIPARSISGPLAPQKASGNILQDVPFLWLWFPIGEKNHKNQNNREYSSTSFSNKLIMTFSSSSTQDDSQQNILVILPRERTRKRNHFKNELFAPNWFHQKNPENNNTSTSAFQNFVLQICFVSQTFPFYFDSAGESLETRLHNSWIRTPERILKQRSRAQEYCYYLAQGNERGIRESKKNSNTHTQE